MKVLATLAALALAAFWTGDTGSPWHMNATAIEACSCPAFCQCYFNDHPAGHHDHGGEAHAYCRFNNAYKINHGNYGNVKLDGAKFWVSGDLGGDFSMGKMDWAVLTFDKSTTKEQREAIGAILPKLFPVQWNSFTTGEGDISWQHEGDTAHALLDNGKTAEVSLKAFKGLKPGPAVVNNVAYWGAARNDGFVVMPNQVEGYHVGDKAFEYKGTNGFMITIDMDAKDYQKK